MTKAAFAKHNLGTSDFVNFNRFNEEIPSIDVLPGYYKRRNIQNWNAAVSFLLYVKSKLTMFPMRTTLVGNQILSITESSVQYGGV